MDCSLPGSSVHGILQAKILEWVCHDLPQGIFLTQGSNLLFLCLLHWQAGSLLLLPPGKPYRGKVKVKVVVTWSCPTLCDPMECSPSGSSVHEILQARILEWVAMPSSRRCSQPRDRTQVSHIASRFFTI